MKKIVCFATFLLINTFIFAKSINFFTSQKPEIILKSGFQIDYLPDNKNTSADFMTIVTFDMRELFWDAGFRLNDENFDFTTQAIYWPTFGKKQNKNAGVGLTYHFYDYPGIFTEHDFFVDAYFKCKPNQYFQIYTRYGLFVKISKIPSVADFMPSIINKTMNFDVVLTFFPSQNWSIYTSFGSNTYFNYPIFLSLCLGGGVEYAIPDSRFTFGVDFMTTWYDGIIVSLNPGLIDSTFYVKVRL